MNIFSALLRSDITVNFFKLLLLLPNQFLQKSSYLIYKMIQLLLVFLLVALLTPLIHDPPAKRLKSEDNEFPSVLVSPHHPDFFNLEIPLRVPIDTKFVVYWAADGPARNATIMPVNVAYNRHDNSGVACVDNGIAVLRLASPQPYTLPCGTVIEPHLQYRLLNVRGGMSQTYQLFLPSDKEHIMQRQLFHSSDYAYLPPVK